jgi:dolichol-phosphate mannosyltransferase
MNLAIVVPVFNELENIPGLIETIETHCQDKTALTWVFCDDGSTDGTYEWLFNESKKGTLHLTGDGKNHGPGKAFENGFQYVLNKLPECEAVLTLEGDGTADITSLDSMLKQLQNHDCVLASVYYPGGGFSKTNPFRLFVSKVANGLTRMLLRLPFRTLTSFYRLYNRKALETLSKNGNLVLEETGFICQVEILLKLHRAGLSIVEVPTVLFTDRRKGQSKMNMGKTLISHLRFILKHS